MGTSPNRVVSSRGHQVAMLQTLIAGLKKHEQGIPLLMILGQSMKVADVVTLLQARLDTTNAVAPAKATWQSTVQADRDERDKTKAVLAALRQDLLVAFAGQVDVLADFGLVGRKPAVVSPETRVAAAAKAKATRAARHTMGKNQRAQIKSTVEVPVSSLPSTAAPPAAVPATPSPAPAAAPSAAPAAGTTPRPPG